MRKIYLTLLMLAGFGMAFGQTNFIPLPSGKTLANQISTQKMNKIKTSVQKFRKAREINNKTMKSRWYSFAFAIDDVLGNPASAAANYLWPDTTVLVHYSSGYSGPWIHALGECLNPTSSYFSSTTELNINKYMPYTIDSVGFYCIYSRDSSLASAVDTLQFQFLIDGDGDYYWEQGQSPWVMTDYGTDTLWFKGIKHDPLSFMTTDPNYQTVKLPLTAAMENDTLANGINYFKAPVGIQVGAGKTFVVAVQFIPGFSWNANTDTITDVNRMRFISYEENGDGGGSGTLPSYTKRDWNASYINFDHWMYNPNSSLYAPSYAFVAAYAYEHHWIEFKLSADETGIAKSVDNTLSVSQNQPNPFNGTTTINYTLASKQNVSLSVYNVAGAKVMDINEGVKSAGAHSIQLNASNLNAGVYYYTLTAGDSRITKKMIVY